MLRHFREARLRALEPAPRVREQDTENEDRQEGDRFEHQSPFALLYLSGEPERPAMQGNGWSLPLLGAPFTESMTMMRSRHDRPIDNEGQCRHDLKAWLMEKNVRQALTSPNWPRCPQKAYRAFSTMNRISRPPCAKRCSARQRNSTIIPMFWRRVWSGDNHTSSV